MTTDRRLRAADGAFLVLLVTLGAALRLYGLDTGLWYDEVVTLLDSVRPPLRQIVSHFPSNNDHPLYSVLAHLSVTAFGETPWALRLPAAAFGVAAIPMVYLLGMTVTWRLEAGAAALVLTVSYHHIWFSQNARGYTALLFWVLLATYALVRWFDTGRRSFLALYAVATAAGAYAHLTMVLVSVSHAMAAGLDWLTHRGASRVAAEWRALATGFASAASLTIMLYAPMLLDVGTFFSTQRASDTEVATPLWALLAGLQGLQVGFGAMWGVAAGAGVAIAGAWNYFSIRPIVAYLFLLPVPVTVLLALALDRPIFPRFIFFAFGFALLIALRGAASVGSSLARWTRLRLAPPQPAAALVGVVTLGAVMLSIRSLPYGYSYPKQDYVAAVTFVERAKDARDHVVVVGEPAATAVQQYLGRPWPQVHDARELQDLRRQAPHVWVLYTFPAYIQAGQPELWAMLRDDCREIHEVEATVAGGSISIRRCP